MKERPSRTYRGRDGATITLMGDGYTLVDGVIVTAPGTNMPDRSEHQRRQSEYCKLVCEHRRHRAASQHRRAPRSTPTRRRGSRRSAASSPTSSADPGDDPDHEPEPRRCGGCGEPLIGRAPQARYCDDACRMAARRGVGRVPVKPAPEWPEEALLEVDLLGVLGQIMSEPPSGARGGVVAPGLAVIA